MTQIDTRIDQGTKAVLRTRFTVADYASVTKQIVQWSSTRESRYLCFAPVHVVMESYASADYAEAVNKADLTLPDGVPVVWALRALGAKHATRVYGPDLTEQILKVAAGRRIPVGFYGSTPETLQLLCERIYARYPELSVAYAYSPPFRPLTAAEKIDVVNQINASGTRILFVGLGCPKQEHWMSQNRGQVRAVMLGVGAAFDFLAGTKPQAPRWMMRAGLEWSFRLITEPRRLWTRYLRHNPHFVMLLAKQLILKSESR